jgi:hypothetical protein
MRTAKTSAKRGGSRKPAPKAKAPTIVVPPIMVAVEVDCDRLAPSERRGAHHFGDFLISEHVTNGGTLQIASKLRELGSFVANLSGLDVESADVLVVLRRARR